MTTATITADCDRANTTHRFPKKSQRRVRVIDRIVKAMTSDEIFRTLDYRNKNEDYIKQYMHQPLNRALVEIHRELAPNQDESTYVKKAKASLLWEGDVGTTINHVKLLGTQHRPDFKLLVEEMRIAVEVKRGESGATIREGVGQSLIYASCGEFDFVVYLFVDTSRDKKVRQSLGAEREHAFVDGLWKNYNVRFDVV